MTREPEKLLERIRIASPCRAGWEQMSGDERVRFCLQCDIRLLVSSPRPDNFDD